MSQNTLTVVPAYGRDYKTAAEARADFDAEKDFIIMDISSEWDTKPMNKQQVPGYRVKIRFNRREDFVFIDVPEDYKPS